MESQELDPDRSARLSGARAEFIASLGRRLEALRSALTDLEQENRSKSRRDNLMRRVHAMGAAARVLGFAAVAEALSAAEAALQRSAGGREVSVGDLAEVSRAFDQLPSLVWGIASTAPAAPREEGEPGEDRGWPLSVLIFGGAALAEGLSEKSPAGAPIETERTEELERARELARIVGPDIVVLDVDRRGARELAQAVLEDPQMEPAPLIVVGTFDTPQSAADLVALGATRVLPKPVSPDTLRRTVLEASQLLSPRRGLREPLGEITIEGLSERIAAEVRRGLIDAAEPLGRQTKVGLGEGTDVLAAVWASVARVRELVTLRSGGAVRFDAAGPEGAIPLAPWSGGDRGAGERGTRDARDGDRVSLEGRTALVADDDPAVVWFIGGLLRAVGTQPVEAHDGRRALELAYETWPDLVVSDLLMPGLDGFSLCREIKRDVAIRDVPVIVLSWKEDLLQRMRELGADADGYLRKEASASTVVQRVREVLRPRARVEARLKAGGEVRGRLDGLTPRLVLQLTCAHRPDARVSIRDAVYLYEVQVRDGRPRCATRTAADGGFERGEGVLGALLGAGAGRFVVTPDRSACRRDFEGSLAQVLKGPIGRARAAQHALSADRFVRVERVEIDETAILAYVASTPEPARSVVQRLLKGAAPRELVVSGEVSPRLLDLVLGDIARHGAVLSVEGADGSDLLARATAELTPAPQPVRSVPPPPTPEPAPQFTMQLSPGPTEVRDISAAVAAPVVMTFGPPPTPEPPRGDLPPVAAFAAPLSPAPPPLSHASSPALPLSRSITPFVPAQEPAAVLGEGTWSAGEPSTLPGVGAVLPFVYATTVDPDPAPSAEPPPPRALTPAPVLTPAPSPSPPVGRKPAQPKLDSADAFAATLNVARREILEAPLPTRMRVSARPSAPSLEPERGGVDLDRAVLEALEESWGSPRPETAVESTEPPREKSRPRKAPPPLPTPLPKPEVAELGGIEEAATALLTKVTEPPQPVVSKPEPEPEPVAAPEPEQAPEASAETAADAEHEPEPARDSAPESAPDPEPEPPPPRLKSQTLRMDTSPSKSDPAASPRVRSAPPKLPASDAPPAAVEPEPSEPVKAPDPKSEGPPRAALKKKSASAPAPASKRSGGVSGAGSRKKAQEAGGSSLFRAVLAFLGAAAAFAAAGLASYAVVSWLKPSDSHPPAAASAAGVSLAVPAPAPSPSAAARPAAPVVEDLVLPTGIPLADGKGLLEVDVGGKQAIYVDSVFVGRGPMRRVPLDPGKHDVMLRLDADEMVQVVEVRAGRRTRLSLAAAP